MDLDDQGISKLYAFDLFYSVMSYPSFKNKAENNNYFRNSIQYYMKNWYSSLTGSVVYIPLTYNFTIDNELLVISYSLNTAIRGTSTVNWTTGIVDSYQFYFLNSEVIGVSRFNPITYNRSIPLPVLVSGLLLLAIPIIIFFSYQKYLNKNKKIYNCNSFSTYISDKFRYKKKRTNKFHNTAIINKSLQKRDKILQENK